MSNIVFAIQRAIKLPGGSTIPVAVVVKTPSSAKLIIATKLLMAISPKIKNFSFLDLGASDESLFNQFSTSFYLATVVRNSGIPSNISYVNVRPMNPYDIPSQPATLTITASGAPNLHEVFYNSATAIDDDAVKADILADITRLVKAGRFPASGIQPEFVAFEDHRPLNLLSRSRQSRVGSIASWMR